MRELLLSYKELTIRQIFFLEQNNNEESLRYVEEKNSVFLKIQKAKKLAGAQEQADRSLEKQLVNEIIALNKNAVKLMGSQKLQISDQLSRLKLSRQAQNAYVPLHSADAYFFDRQK